ncbi:hypothetical protein ASPCAL10659 [Aspergillus calidoustus]|uniref:Uncharacterized protein n=1 Tax=Aspergillus calidoustus TaxID=454130 RepID=A0A0U5GA74_ASPCI|nr:hypothetical protein ASPCAL10659 [Aspergillus calidoustus]
MRGQLRKDNHWESDTPRGCCGRMESQVYTGSRTRHSGLHPLYPSTLLCDTCTSWVERNNRRRTQLEADGLLLEFHLEGARNMGEAIECENCHIMESNPDCHGCPHEANHRTALVLCHFARDIGMRRESIDLRTPSTSISPNASWLEIERMVPAFSATFAVQSSQRSRNPNQMPHPPEQRAKMAKRTESHESDASV